MLRKIFLSLTLVLAYESTFAQYQSNSIIYMERRDGNGNVYRDTIRSNDMSDSNIMLDTIIQLPGGGTFHIGGGGANIGPMGDMPDMNGFGFDFNDPFSGFEDMDRLFEQQRRMMEEMLRGMPMPNTGQQAPPPVNSAPNKAPSKKPKGIGI